MRTQLSKPPIGFVNHIFETSFKLSDEKAQRVWEALQMRETFCDGQIFPYQVEFASPIQKGKYEPGGSSLV